MSREHYCAACHRYINSLGWATHRSGKKHKENVKKLLDEPDETSLKYQPDADFNKGI